MWFDDLFSPVNLVVMNLPNKLTSDDLAVQIAYTPVDLKSSLVDDVGQDLVEKHLQSVADHTSFNESYRRATDWLNGAEQRLGLFTSTTADTVDAVKHQHELITVSAFDFVNCVVLTSKQASKQVIGCFTVRQQQRSLAPTLCAGVVFVFPMLVYLRLH